MNRSKQVKKEFFIQQLEFIDENIKDLTGHYVSSTPILERSKHFFHSYVLEVEDLLTKNCKNNLIATFSKVYIGTKVTVHYDEENETEDYAICFPEQSNPDKGFVSFLSPVGRQLLLKNLGEQLSLSTPTGNLLVTIKDISSMEDMNLFETVVKYQEA